MIDRHNDVLDVVPTYKKFKDGTKKPNGYHGIVTGRLAERPKISIVTYKDKKTGKPITQPCLHFKIKSHHVSKKLAYILGDQESETWTDRHGNTYFQVNIWFEGTIKYLKKHVADMKLNQELAAIGFLDMKPRQDKNGVWYPNFCITSQNILL